VQLSSILKTMELIAEEYRPYVKGHKTLVGVVLKQGLDQWLKAVYCLGLRVGARQAQILDYNYMDIKNHVFF